MGAGGAQPGEKGYLLSLHNSLRGEHSQGEVRLCSQGTGQEETVSNCAKGGSGWTSGGTSSWILWSGTGRVCPGGGGVPISGGVQRMAGGGTQCSGLGDKVGISHRLDMVVLEVFSKPNHSVILMLTHFNVAFPGWLKLLKTMGAWHQHSTAITIPVPAGLKQGQYPQQPGCEEYWRDAWSTSQAGTAAEASVLLREDNHLIQRTCTTSCLMQGS